MDEQQQKKKLFFIKLNENVSERKESVKYFLYAFALLACVYLTELFHLLDKPLFSLVYYGYLADVAYNLVSAVFLIGVLIGFHRIARKFLGTRLLEKREDDETLSLYSRIALYVMTALPIILTGIFLGFQFKVVYELGEKVNMYTLINNLSGYALNGAKLIAFLYFIMLTQTVAEKLFETSKNLPFGGFLCMITFGLIEVFVSPSIFAWLYFALCLYYGIIYLVSGRRFFVTFTLMMLLYVL